MKIAMMVRGYIPAPRPTDIVYAPIDLAVSIAEGLAKRGHKVDFYGPRGTKLKSGVKTHNLRPLAKNQREFQELLMKPDLLAHYRLNLWDGYLAHDMFEGGKRGEYDLLHFDHPEVALIFTQMYPGVPVAYTLHDPIYEWYQEIFKMYESPDQYFISISNNQRRAAPHLNYIATVYHGIDTSLFPYSNKNDGYLLYVGRIVEDKGVKEAIEVAKKTGDRLILVGPVYPDKKAYFDKYIKPHINGQIEYLGYVDRYEVSRYYQKAKAFLAPLQWEEPFGVTFLESMASGTPVVAFKRGSAREVIVDGKTGYLVNNVEEMARAVQKIDKIKRLEVRRYVEKKFSIDDMVDGYEEAFKKIISKSKK